MLKPSS